MATYAAFKHVELYNVGKTKKRVLRPPGGGSSDIFGSQTPSTPRSMRNHMASNIFGSTQDASVKNSVRQGMHRYYFIGDNARRGVKNGDSHSRLFGEVNRSFTPAKNHMKSSIPLGGPETKVTNGNGTASSVPTPTNGHADGKNGKVENNNSLGGDHHQNGVSKTGYRRRITNNNSHSTDDTSSSQVSPTNVMYGHDVNDNASDGKYNNSSVTSSSIVSPVSGISLDSGGDNSSKSSFVRSPRVGNSRNPVTGLGIDMPSYKSRTRALLRKDGNPVTGEGYTKSAGISGGAEINTTVPSLNGANQVINKNRIPPGGYSSGLW